MTENLCGHHNEGFDYKKQVQVFFNGDQIKYWTNNAFKILCPIAISFTDLYQQTSSGVDATLKR